MERDQKGVAGFDLCEQINQTMRLAVRQAMITHTARNGCEWEPGAFEALINSATFKATVDTIHTLPSFVQLCKELESYELCKQVA